ncbi:UDP-N-acetylmuramate--alanine ligase [Taibaiella sp. KBW10]|uniref:UDP-N-acetylmuramate--L-alanine ligase n=1 Tax=Taibaiella sp. KBW10 TaxID=2153357 RepID=UPI000F5AD719|nr:Mur ligase domain-containing protein [Taibaiella sp. KBW10]RQO30287.1 UDP-N-acetylmuramate--alanine ligase [Taibaiella sp. KBW10]
MTEQILDKQNFFFAGVAGAGMSAIAQYLSGTGKHVAGSDRLFNTEQNNHTKQQLEAEGITCYHQLKAQIKETDEVLVVSTAIEDTNVEVARAKSLHIPIITRAQLLAQICESKKTIAIAGTSGKSTTAAMLFHLLTHSGIDASLITGAGIVSLIKQGKIGNCHVGKSDWLIIEADESDGSLVQYKPSIGVLLSVDKDHKELSELHEIFSIFKSHTKDYFIVNQSHALAKSYSTDTAYDFGTGAATSGTDFKQEGFNIYFKVAGIPFQLPTIGAHNMENALACIAVAKLLHVTLTQCAAALQNYPGIYRRHQLLGKLNGITVIDDYAHNPAKIAASIEACKPVADKLIAWFQPHGFAPTRFIRAELVAEITRTLRPQDEMWMSEIYYAGGTTTKDISAHDLIKDLQNNGVQAYFVADRNELIDNMQSHFTDDCVILLMGARDPSLEQFGDEVMNKLNLIV